jgi:hypothetical protein
MDSQDREKTAPTVLILPARFLGTKALSHFPLEERADPTFPSSWLPDADNQATTFFKLPSHDAIYTQKHTPSIEITVTVTASAIIATPNNICQFRASL